MHRLLTFFYRRLPYAARVIMATAHGYSLRCWRYGRETDELVAAALERDGWDPAHWRAYQEERLGSLLWHAATHVPYYREQWARRRRAGDRASPELLERWPVLTKEALRQHPEAFVADGSNRRFLFELHTSGSTGKPLRLWRSRKTLRTWYALMEARWRRWYGVSRHDRWAILGGQLVTPFEQSSPPYWVWNGGLNQLYMSSYHLRPANIPAYLQAIQRYRLSYLWGYSSSLNTIAQSVLEQGLSAPHLRVVITNAEPLFDYQRKCIATAFPCPVRETYGLSEMVCAASECEHGGLHLWPEVSVAEVLGDLDGQPLGPQETGQLIVTGLLAEEMPLIRYRTGDRGALSDELCPCGRGLPLLQSIEGRSDDLILTPDGRRVGRLDPVFKADFAIREAQIVQESLHEITVRLVPAQGYTPADGQAIVQALRQRVGDMDISLDPVAEIPRGPNGKFRAVISRLAEHDGSFRPSVAENGHMASNAER